MEENHKNLHSIWGKWWDLIRKWFYPAWLSYEASIRFYDYALAVHNYFINQQDYIASYIGETGAQILDIFCSLTTFVLCSAFLTVPACFTLYKFFDSNNLTDTRFEWKMKRLF